MADYLHSDCNLLPIPDEDFRMQFCDRCRTPDCERSNSGKNLFDIRAKQWESKLFLNVPTLPPNDPRFAQIRAKRFIEVDTSPVTDIRSNQGWLDPLAKPKKKTFEQMADAVGPIPTSVLASIEPPLSNPPPAPLAEQEPTAQPSPPPAPTTRPNADGVPANTPFVQGQILAGAPKSEAPVYSQWAAPKPQTATGPASTVIKPGARIKLGK